MTSEEIRQLGRDLACFVKEHEVEIPNNKLQLLTDVNLLNTIANRLDRRPNGLSKSR